MYSALEALPLYLCRLCRLPERYLCVTLVSIKDVPNAENGTVFCWVPHRVAIRWLVARHSEANIVMVMAIICNAHCPRRYKCISKCILGMLIDSPAGLSAIALWLGLHNYTLAVIECNCNCIWRMHLWHIETESEFELDGSWTMRHSQAECKCDMFQNNTLLALSEFGPNSHSLCAQKKNI